MIYLLPDMALIPWKNTRDGGMSFRELPAEPPDPWELRDKHQYAKGVCKVFVENFKPCLGCGMLKPSTTFILAQ